MALEPKQLPSKFIIYVECGYPGIGQDYIVGLLVGVYEKLTEINEKLNQFRILLITYIIT